MEAVRHGDLFAHAPLHFHLPTGLIDLFGNIATVAYDTDDHLAVRSEDALRNVATAINDYRVLLARQTTDANGNRATVAFDELGMALTFVDLSGTCGLTSSVVDFDS